MKTSFAKRIIPCLDVKDGRVVKGVNFVSLKDAGDPVAVAASYNEAGADEICFLDISATNEGRKTTANVVYSVAKQLFIPLSVGGGIRELDDIWRLLDAGCDKVSLNSAAISNPRLIEQAATRFGSQCVVVAIDVKKEAGELSNSNLTQRYKVFTHGGTKGTELDALEWARRVCELGAGEILLTSMDADGTKEGYDLALTKLTASLPIPVIASGGAGRMEHFLEAFNAGADAALAASVFHFKQIEILRLKQFLADNGVCVRI